MSDPEGPAYEETPEAVETPEHPEPAEPSRRRNLGALVIAVASAILLLVVALAVPYALDAYRDATRPTLAAVKVFEVGNDHTDNEVEYDPAPAPGGPHDPAWLECGTYDEPVREENVEHSLEHGSVWITYDPDEVDGDEIGELEGELPLKGILSPYPGQSAPVIVSVWGAQLELDGADDDRLALFLREYGDGHTSPEPMMSCAGGVERFESEDAGGPDGIDDDSGVNV